MTTWRICVESPEPLDDGQREDLLAAVRSAGRAWEQTQGEECDWDWDLEIYAGSSSHAPARPVSQGTEDSPEHPVSYLSQRAVEITAKLHAAGFEPSVQRQVLGLAEEVGGFVGAYRRWSGQARRSGTKKDMHLELADVVITAYVAAVEMGFDLDAAINDKLAIVFSRGWREEAS